MIVEDEVIIAMHLQNLLEAQGHEVIDHALSGEEALEMLKNNDPDLVFMDIILAGAMDGVETTKQINENFSLPVVYLTANTDVITIDRAKKTAPSGFLTKPFDEASIRSTIEISVSNYRAAEEIKQANATLKQQSELQEMSINELSVTNKHLIEVTWRERELNNELAKAKEEIEKTNYEIRESINYARRIQSAIVPSETEIKEDLPDHFILFKPKDIVSGDFPWHFKNKEVVYIAAVDCTGHGVPGAMMSMIGYILMNNIVKGDKIVTPAELLSELHQAIVATLKQDDPDKSISDGMDMAICMIDKHNRKLTFAGAHRPLYFVRAGELTQFKGAKYPIGGIHYKGKNTFENHEMEIQKGDSILIFTDGYQDQFGGPDCLKYGPKRIRTKFSELAGRPMGEIKAFYDKEFDDWIGDEKQVDDVLMIGINF